MIDIIGIYKQFQYRISSWRYAFIKHAGEPVWEFTIILTIYPAQTFNHHLTDDVNSPRLFPFELLFKGWETDTRAARRWQQFEHSRLVHA